jgi:hypothetical protein
MSRTPGQFIKPARKGLRLNVAPRRRRARGCGPDRRHSGVELLKRRKDPCAIQLAGAYHPALATPPEGSDHPSTRE